MNTIPKLINSTGNNEEGANWILSYYAKKYEPQFIAVCQELGYPIKLKNIRSDGSGNVDRE